MSHRAAWSAGIALILMLCQFAAIRTSVSGLEVRVVVPLTMAAVPIALSAFRRRVGIWIMFVGMAANLAAILANGGLMPIEHHTLVDAIGEEHAARYEPGQWVAGSKDVLVGAGSGRLVALGDSIIIRLGDAGIVASPGDLVVWAGLAVLAGEASVAVQRGRRTAAVAAKRGDPARSAGAEGGAVTRT
jgi:hypothetical protein